MNFWLCRRRLDKQAVIFKNYDFRNWTTNNYNTQTIRQSAIWSVNRIQHEKYFLTKLAPDPF